MTAADVTEQPELAGPDHHGAVDGREPVLVSRLHLWRIEWLTRLKRSPEALILRKVTWILQRPQAQVFVWIESILSPFAGL